MEQLHAIYFECQCLLAEHTIRFIYDPEYGDLYTEIYLHQHKPWYVRIWYALQYIFGPGKGHGHFDSCLMKPQDCTSLIALLQIAQKKQEENPE